MKDPNGLPRGWRGQLTRSHLLVSPSRVRLRQISPRLPPPPVVWMWVARVLKNVRGSGGVLDAAKRSPKGELSQAAGPDESTVRRVSES